MEGSFWCRLRFHHPQQKLVNPNHGHIGWRCFVCGRLTYFRRFHFLKGAVR